MESGMAQGGIARAAGAARANVHGPIKLEVAQLLQPGGPYTSTFTTPGPETKRQRTNHAAQSVEEGAASLWAQHIGLEHVEILLCSGSVGAVKTHQYSERCSGKTDAIDVYQLAAEFELKSALQRQTIGGGSVDSSACGVLLRPPTVEEAATARVGGGMLSGVSSLFLSAYCAPVVEHGSGIDCADDARNADEHPNLQSHTDTTIDAARAAARARRRRYAQLVSCQLWCVEPRSSFAELSVSSRM